MDLRRPSGYFFGLLGVLVVLMGVFSPESRAPLSEGNVNLACGIAMLSFAAVLLFLAHRRPQS
jgi:hypothetical protein